MGPLHGRHRGSLLPKRAPLYSNTHVPYPRKCLVRPPTARRGRRAEWSPKRLIHWGESIGANTGAIVEHLLRSKPHPEQGYRACLGLLALAREYGEPRLETASLLAMRLGSPTRKSVKSILESGRDLQPQSDSLAFELPAHGNVRGPGYYH